MSFVDRKVVFSPYFPKLERNLMHSKSAIELTEQSIVMSVTLVTFIELRWIWHVLL